MTAFFEFTFWNFGLLALFIGAGFLFYRFAKHFLGLLP